jgi:hypothetical protein
MTERPFELGLVMAGAISAGAYTAGVMDFLIEALDAWEAEKAKRDSAVPRHEVKLRVLSGASAGGMTSAISTVALSSEIDPVRDPANPPAAERNRLYDAWVRQIDITKLLGTSDIEAAGAVKSLLDATPLQSIAEAALISPLRSTPRSYVDDPLVLMLSVANLRGVPYSFKVLGGSATARYGMFEHMDHMRFAMSRSAACTDAGRHLVPADAPDGEWPKLVMASLASGAFPGGLAPRLLERPYADYDERHVCRPLQPAGEAPYRFLCVDGGLIDNEPLELARRHLSGGAEKRNPREGDQAHRAVVLIDPFPNDATLSDSYKPKDSLTAVLVGMFSALKNQARFKPQELELAEAPDVYSRFMIAPSRRDAADEPVEPAIASGIVGGFGGFLHETLRQHDFQLGRRNCQAFLRWHFVLPESNPVVAASNPEARARFRVRQRDGSADLFDGKDGSQVPLLPIIPLVGDAAIEVPAPPPPSGAAVDLARLKGLAGNRIKRVGSAIISSDLKSLAGGIGSWIGDKAWRWYLAGRTTDRVMGAVERQLARLR